MEKRHMQKKPIDLFFRIGFFNFVTTDFFGRFFWVYFLFIECLVFEFLLA